MAREFAKAFYNSKEWQKCRDYVLRRDNYLCIRCGNPAEEVHHKKHLTPKNITDANISLNPDNLICLCRDCHFAEHKADKERAVVRANKYRKKHRRVTENGMYFDDNGVFMYRKVIVVYGSPRAGKNSYVKAHKEETDIVVDVDSIISALQIDDVRRIDNNILYLALDIRDFILSKIANNDKNIDCKTVWIIGGFPTRKEREELSARLNAELIYIDADKDTCVRRSRQDNLYGDEDYSEYVVRDWWRRYEADS